MPFLKSLSLRRSIKAPSAKTSIAQDPPQENSSTQDPPEETSSAEHPEDDVTNEEEIEDDDGIRRDPFFYHVPLVILVEDTLFKISRFYFEKHSEIFRDTYLRPPNDDKPLDGLTDEQPLRLDEIDASQFECLLAAIIQRDQEEETDITMSCMEWTGIFKLAVMWEMKLVVEWALTKIPVQIHGSDDWTDALRLSTQLNIPGLRTIAIQALANELAL